MSHGMWLRSAVGTHYLVPNTMYCTIKSGNKLGDKQGGSGGNRRGTGYDIVSILGSLVLLDARRCNVASKGGKVVKVVVQ